MLASRDIARFRHQGLNEAWLHHGRSPCALAPCDHHGAIPLEALAMRYYAGTGITLGSLLAVLLSWSYNHSVFWAIIHFFCSWLYVLYALLGHPHVLVVG
jgi:hypothetical protein